MKFFSANTFRRYKPGSPLSTAEVFPPGAGQSGSDWKRPLPNPLWAMPGRPSGEIPAGSHLEQEIRAVLARYANTLHVPISFRTSANWHSRPASPDALHVHAFALPTPPVLFGFWQRVNIVELPIVHGFPLAERACRAFGPTPVIGRGRLLLDGDGRVVGEHLGTNLYCLFDLLAQQEAWIPLLIRCQLDLGLPSLAPALPLSQVVASQIEDGLRALRSETQSRIQVCRQHLLRDTRDAYTRVCREALREEIRQLQTEATLLEESVDETTRHIVADTRRLEACRRRLGVSRGLPGPGSSTEHELAAVRSLPEVRDLRFEDGRLCVTTGPILANYAGRAYLLGCFQLDLAPSGDVRIWNLTGRVGADDHPHIHQGRPSLGTIREGTAKLLGESQLCAATEVLIDFLKTVHPAHWRLPVWQWPEAGCESGRGAFAAT
jgi:hypothetical protein